MTAKEDGPTLKIPLLSLPNGNATDARVTVLETQDHKSLNESDTPALFASGREDCAPRTPRLVRAISYGASLSLAAAELDGVPEFRSYEPMFQQDQSDGGIMVVFVVSFDNNLGNTVEWWQSVWDPLASGSLTAGPPEFSPHGLEFRALPAGVHNLDDDCLYFRHGGLYGISAFHRLLLSHEGGRGERHARMRSVGALSLSLRPLASCLPVLKTEAARRNMTKDAAPDYSRLAALLTTHPRPPAFSKSPVYPGTLGLPSPPREIFSEFVDELGPQVMLVWKALLLRKRIMFFAPPPVSFSCDLVLSACALLNGGPPSTGATRDSPGSRTGEDSLPPLIPLFSVGLHDADLLLQTPFYVACTSEAIMKHKTKLYDVILEARDKRWEVQVPSRELSSLIYISEGDQLRFQELCGIPQPRHDSSRMHRLFPCCPPASSSQVLTSTEPDLDRLDRMGAINTRIGQAVAEARSRASLANSADNDSVRWRKSPSKVFREDNLRILLVQAELTVADRPFVEALLEPGQRLTAE